MVFQVEGGIIVKYIVQFNIPIGSQPITVWSQVRILPGPLDPKTARCKNAPFLIPLQAYSGVQPGLPSSMGLPARWGARRLFLVDLPDAS